MTKDNKVITNNDVIPSLAWHMRCSFETEVNSVIPFRKFDNEEVKSIVQTYLKERIKELKEYNK